MHSFLQKKQIFFTLKLLLYLQENINLEIIQLEYNVMGTDPNIETLHLRPSVNIK
jgi:hypothetical protein